jgi:hypothetical protein
LRVARATGSDVWGRMGVKVSWDMNVGWHCRSRGSDVGPMSGADLWRATRKGRVEYVNP